MMNKNLFDKTDKIEDAELSLEGYFDYLTGLQNMVCFFKNAEQNRRKISSGGGHAAFLFINFVGIKYYNRRYGFSVGNLLLMNFADLLSHLFGRENCCRYGQDHFGVAAEAEGLNERLEKLFDGCKQLNDGNSLPIRVGVYLDEHDDVDINTICDRTKIACDMVGDIFESRVVYFDESMLAKEERQQYIITHLDQAIDEGWIQVYYQPIVRAINGRVCDDEALARWIDPQLGFLSPADFIPILEEARLIYKLDLCVLEQVLARLNIQKRRGYTTIPSSINLSRSDFDSCDMVEEIRKRVDEAGIERSQLAIEITESIVGKDVAFIKEQVDRFHELGFQVWMDDFGSGYSSLDVLQQIRFDLIKFDMHFMRQFNKGESGKIILTELMKMASALGLDMICEGVETEEQVQFLQMIGCSKLQGFYYEKPISQDELFSRYEKGLTIGFENPAEAEYYNAVGRVNLYDLGVFTNEDSSSFHNFFNTLPMAIVEYRDESIRMVRSNQSYQEFMMRAFDGEVPDDVKDFSVHPKGIGSFFMSTIRQCCQSGDRAFMDDRVSEEFVIHSFMKRIAENPVTKTYAVAIVILYVRDDSRENTFENLAKALSADYFNIFYVNMKTEEFIEYTSPAGSQNLTVERHGNNFFAASRRDAMKLLYEDDQIPFIQKFTKENVLKALDTQGNFALPYRLKAEGEPTYVLMKAIRLSHDSDYVIIGVSSIDVQMKQKEAIDRINREQVVFKRIQALTSDYIAFYTVNPETGNFYEYSSGNVYKGLEITTEGEDFFAKAAENGKRVIFKEDLDYYLENFTLENVLHDIEVYGLFSMQYRLILDGVVTPMRVKVVKVEEPDGEKLIVGVLRTDDHH